MLSFLTGSVFRMIWGEISSWLTKRQDHKQEVERLQEQEKLESAAHERNQANIRLQAELNVRQVEVQKDAGIMVAEAEAFKVAMADAFKPTGIAWVDSWNSSIRPAYATIALFLWLAKIAAQGWVMDGFDVELFASIAGFFFADRALARRGK
jgi:hypothetical protein